MLKVALAVFLIVHGLVHAILAAAPSPNDPDAKPNSFFTAADRSSLLSQLGLDAAVIRWAGIILVALTTLGFILVGLGILGVPGLSTVWRMLAVVSSCVSLLLLTLFWHRWLVVGVLIDIGILIAILWAK